MGASNFPTVTDRSVQYPSRVRLTPLESETDVYDVEAVPGVIENEGTLLNSTLFNNIRDNSIWPISNGGTGATTAAQARTNLGVTTWQDIYPVGAVYMSVVNTSPQILFGGTWESLATDKFIRIAAPNDTLGSGGEDYHYLTINELPSHNHYGRGYAYVADYSGDYTVLGAMSGGTAMHTTYETGGGAAFNNMPAYTEIYAWKRTA